MLGRLDAAVVEEWASHFLDPSVVKEMIEALGSLSVLRNGLSASQNRELLTTRDGETAEALILLSIDAVASNRIG